MDDKRLRNAHGREPESMSVNELNQAVRDLRELLYQKQLQVQELQDLKAPQVFASKAEKRRVLTLFLSNDIVLERDRLLEENRKAKNLLREIGDELVGELSHKINSFLAPR